MRDKGRNIDKISRFDILLKFQLIAPADLALAGDNIDHCLKLAMMMFPAGDMWFDHSHASPQSLRSSQCPRNSGSSLHPWCLGRTSIELLWLDNPDAVFPRLMFCLI